MATAPIPISFELSSLIVFLYFIFVFSSFNYNYFGSLKASFLFYFIYKRYGDEVLSHTCIVKMLWRSEHETTDLHVKASS